MGVSDMDTRSQTVTLVVAVFQKWNDPRLAFDSSCGISLSSYPSGPATLPFDPQGSVWAPEWFVDNLAKGKPKSEDVIKAYWRLSPNGDVVYTKRAFWAISCDMNFRDMP